MVALNWSAIPFVSGRRRGLGGCEQLLLTTLLVFCVLSERLLVELSDYSLGWEHAKYVRSSLFDVRIVWVESSGFGLWSDNVVVEVAHRDAGHVKKNLLALDRIKRVEEDRPVLTRRLQSRPLKSLSRPPSDADFYNVTALHQKGYRGQNVRVAIFDTGISSGCQRFFNHPVHLTYWTHDESPYDTVGHGTFITGLVAGMVRGCPGLAPDAEIVTFRVFTGAQTSYTSWFLNAFNYAMQTGVDIVSLSIGGPDHFDQPFTDKVNEVTAAGIIFVSAIGNDGLFGSVNNPADMMDVVGIGGLERNINIASFSSRGMTTSELRLPIPSYGRVKPDIVTIARDLRGPGLGFRRCISLSGTSVATPIVTGSIALLLSAVPEERRRTVVNPAAVKRALIRGAKRILDSSMYEQGAGFLDVQASLDEMLAIDEEYVNNERNEVQLQLLPFYLDFTAEDCPYMWPFCKQPFYATMQPVSVNVTILNPNSALSEVSEVLWVPSDGQDVLLMQYTLPPRFWPWAGGMGIHISVKPESEGFKGIVSGLLNINVRSIPSGLVSKASLPVRVEVRSPPEREKRILWDISHNLAYPPGFIPKDNLDSKDPLDWLGDHPHTNFHGFHDALVENGYFVEIWDKPFTCFTRAIIEEYSTLLIIDPEDDFSRAESEELERAVREYHLVAVVVAEWYNLKGIDDLAFEEGNTRSFWKAVGGGANVPAINKLLKPFGIAFGDSTYSGFLPIGGQRVPYKSGTSIIKFPESGYVLVGNNFRQVGLALESGIPVFGMSKARNEGGLIVFGDSTCLDTETPGVRCYDLFIKAIGTLTRAVVDHNDMSLADLGETGMLARVDANLKSARHVRFSGGDLFEIPAELKRLMEPHIAENRKRQACEAVRETPLANSDILAEHIVFPRIAPAALPPERRATLSSGVGIISLIKTFGAILVLAFCALVVWLLQKKRNKDSHRITANRSLSLSIAKGFGNLTRSRLGRNRVWRGTSQSAEDIDRF